jgi:hypothetical protein
MLNIFGKVKVFFIYNHKYIIQAKKNNIIELF